MLPCISSQLGEKLTLLRCDASIIDLFKLFVSHVSSLSWVTLCATVRVIIYPSRTWSSIDQLYAVHVSVKCHMIMMQISRLVIGGVLQDQFMYVGVNGCYPCISSQLGEKFSLLRYHQDIMDLFNLFGTRVYSLS